MTVSIPNPGEELKPLAISTNGHTPAAFAAKMIVPELTSESESEKRHPLDVPTHSNLKLGWINDYADIACELTAAPRQFHLLAALVIVASATQGKAFVRTQFAPMGIFPNLYACNIAISGAYGKGTTTDLVRYILREAMLDRISGPSHFTSEGLVSYLSDKPNVLILRNEIATLYSSDRVKHTKDLKMDLTDLYDCKPFARKLSQREVKVERPFLSLLGSTTPDQFYSNVVHADFTSGLIPRFLFALPGESEKPDFRKSSGSYTDSHEERVKSLAFRLMTFESQKEKQFIFVDGALDAWVNWQADAMEYAFLLNDSISMSILRRYNTYALKFATILAAINGEWGFISPETMNTSIKLADNYKALMYRILTEGNRHKMTGDKANKIFNVIKRLQTEEKGATLRRIAQYTNMTTNDVEPYLESLTVTGEVGTEPLGRTVTYKAEVDRLRPRDWQRAG